MSTIQQKIVLIPPSGVLEFQTGNFALLLSATAAVNVRIERGNGGHAEQFDALTGGVLFRRVQSWSNFRILGTAGTSVTVYIGYADTDIDETDVRLQIATIAGTASVAVSPATAAACPAASTILSGNGATVAANASRKRITFAAPDTNTETIYVQPGIAFSADRRGYPLAPGTFVQVDGIYQIGVYNPGAASQQYSTVEET